MSAEPECHHVPHEQCVGKGLIACVSVYVYSEVGDLLHTFLPEGEDLLLVFLSVQTLWQMIYCMFVRACFFLDDFVVHEQCGSRRFSACSSVCNLFVL